MYEFKFEIREMLKFCYLSVMIIFICCDTKPEKQSGSIIEPEIETNTKTNKESINKTILFFGNSLTAGMGLDPQEAFPAIIQLRLDSLGLKFEVINSGLSGETTASGLNRLNWVLKKKVDVFILELGANDGLRGIPLSETRKNLQAIVDQVRLKNPATVIILAGMMIPPNMGHEYTQEFKNIFPVLAKKNKLLLIPFLLDGVAGDKSLNQNDGIHPTAEGQKIVAENVWLVLKELFVE